MGDLSEYQKREPRNPDGIANAIIFKRNYPGNEHLSFLIVEGDTDRRLYRTFVDEARCNINVAYSKSTVLEVLSILEQNNFPGILVIVDADFDALAGKYPTSPNIVFTDTHDLETMIIKSPALEKVLSEFASEEKINQFIRKRDKDVLAVLIECSKPIGYLRWASLQEGLSLTFEGLVFGKFIDKEQLTVGEAKLFKTVKDKSGRQNIADSQLKKSAQTIKKDSHDPWHVCCGHDLVSVLSIGLCKAIGSWNAGDVKIDVLERSLRLAYERAHFQQTQLYTSIQQWEQANTPFVVLKMA